MKDLAMICLCGHSPFQYILLVGNCKACKDSTFQHQPHCYKYRDQEIWRKRISAHRKRYNLFRRARSVA